MSVVKRWDEANFETYQRYEMLLLHSEYYIQKQLPEVFCKKGVLKNFSKFIGKHMSHKIHRKTHGVSFLIKLQASGLQLY